MTTPDAMCHAAREPGLRNFFTDTVHISSLTQVPAVGHSIASQYSEGCFSTWDTDVDALVATVTGSARPVEKAAITEADLVIITGVREDGMGALVRHVEDKANDPPSSEAVEMYDMDADLPQVRLDDGSLAPVIRSKLHGHRGVKAYDPRYVEYVSLDSPFFSYPVTCGTDAQAPCAMPLPARRPSATPTTRARWHSPSCPATASSSARSGWTTRSRSR
ncbi:MAG: hypothetical protein R2844_02010 [Caldilineales bacterium]